MAQPTQTDPQFKLRLPRTLKERVEHAAEMNNRSMNAEIVAILESAFPYETPRILMSRKIAVIVERLESEIGERERERLEQDLRDTILALQQAPTRTPTLQQAPTISRKRVINLQTDEQEGEGHAPIQVNRTYE